MESSTLDAPPDAVEPPQRRAHPRRLLVGLLAAALLVAGGWWLMHPTAFPEQGGFGVRSTLNVGERLYVGAGPMSGPGASTKALSLHSIEPRVLWNSAEARVTAMLCPLSGSGGIGAVPEWQPHCTSLTTLAGFDGRWGTDRAQVVLEIVPERDGVVVVEGVTIRYRDGVRWGAQVTGGTFEATATDEGAGR